MNPELQNLVSKADVQLGNRQLFEAFVGIDRQKGRTDKMAFKEILKIADI
ncbi:MAG: hypothetical protein OXB88_01385 [Bacteriovoracales bacterium]|nr:hypothetical protein [Bacteriovoracales bacterium]